VIHQQNRRTGESNVANPYGTSATDFYIRCIKKSITNLKTDEEQFEHFIVQKAISLIAQRNEPTPYQILFNGLLAEISSAGFDLEDFDRNIEQILSKHIDDIFVITDAKSKAGKNWWFKNPNEYIQYPDKKLTDRVEDTIISLLRQKVSVSFDEVLGKIFVKYPNGLTPDIKSIDQILKKYANKSGGKWVYKGGETEKDFTQHTEMLYFLSEIGKKMGYKVYIGKREQPENYNGKKLVDFVDLKKLEDLGLEKEKKDRIEMSDMVWVKNKKIDYVIEVENSTNFTSGIQRASNLDIGIKKIMLLPNKRKNEFLGIKDPLFIDSFKKYNWSYMFYDDVLKIKTSRNITDKTLDTFLKKF
jgi:hypothetical protein